MLFFGNNAHISLQNTQRLLPSYKLQCFKRNTDLGVIYKPFKGTLQQISLVVIQTVVFGRRREESVNLLDRGDSLEGKCEKVCDDFADGQGVCPGVEHQR